MLTRVAAGRRAWAVAVALVAAGGPAAAADPPRGQDEFRAAWLAWAARQYDDALAAITKAVAVNGGAAEYRECLGYMSYSRGKYRDAEPELERAGRMSPKEPRVPYLLAQMYGMRYSRDVEEQQRLRDKSFEYYQRAVALDPDNGFPQAQCASALFDAGRDEEGRKVLAAAVAHESFRLYLLPTPPPREPAEKDILWRDSLDLLNPALARFNNLSSRCRRRAAVARASGDQEQAKGELADAGALGRRVAAMEPPLLSSALLGLDIDARAQRALANLLRAAGDAQGADAAEARASASEKATALIQEEIRGWAAPDATPAEDVRERETKLVEKALRLAYPDRPPNT